jgi:hypothetical protein
VRRAFPAGRRRGTVPIIRRIPNFRCCRNGHTAGFFDECAHEAVRAKLPTPFAGPSSPLPYLLRGWRIQSRILPSSGGTRPDGGRRGAPDPGTTKNQRGGCFPSHGTPGC